MAGDWQRIKQIYAEAMTRGPDSRAAYLLDVCPDEALRQEVEELLVFDARADSDAFLERPALPPASAFFPTLRSGQRVGPYEIDRTLGQGGMGQVHLATDIRLARRVALKMIHPEVAGSPENRERFLREARSAALLNHPNIATVYDVGEVDGRLYLSMEFVEGQPLRSLLPKEGFPESVALAYASQLASALDHAHSRAILHRDLKPENVIVQTNGVVKLIDFGIAKSLPGSFDAPDTQLTDTGKFIGTLAYAPPEVLSGSPSTRQGDLYSLGIVLFEMLCGQTPYGNLPGLSLAAAILNGKPALLQHMNSRISAGVTAVVHCCMAADPQERFSSAARLLEELESLREGKAQAGSLDTWRAQPKLWYGAALLLTVLLLSAGLWSRQAAPRGSSVQTKSLAILPFAVTGAGPGEESFSNGLLETLNRKLTGLTVHRDFQVAPATDVRTRHVAQATEARMELGATIVVNGTIRFSGDSIHIACVLIDATSNQEIRRKEIVAERHDPFAVQDRVVEAVVAMLDLHLNDQERMSLFGHGTEQPGAYDFYLQGRGYLLDFDKAENLDSAVAVFRRALEIDPRYALAYAGLGEAYWRKEEVTKNTSWVEPARGACEGALGIDASLAASHACLGMVLVGTGQYEKGAEEYRLALDREPGNDLLYIGLANAYYKLNRTEEAEKTYRAAIQVRPRYWAAYNALGVYYYRLGRNDDALAMFRQVVSLAPDSFRGYRNLGSAYSAKNQNAEAIAAYEKSLSIRPSYESFSNLGSVYFFAGDFPRSAKAFQQALASNRSDYRVWRNLAASRLWSGDSAGAAEAFTEARKLATDQFRVDSRNPDVLVALAQSNAALGEKEKAREQIEAALRQAPEDSAILFEAAEFFEYNLGRRDDALKWLEKAIKRGQAWKFIDGSPGLKALRQDERFLRLKQSR